jgi:hypothetical protein
MITLSVILLILALSAAIFHSNEKDPYYKIHKAQQDALRLHHKMMAMDKNEPKYQAWWRSLGIGS